MLSSAKSTGDRPARVKMIALNTRKTIYTLVGRNDLITDVNKKPSRDLGILIGLLLTDGCVRRNKWKITFSNKSKALQNFFKKKFTSVFGNTNFIEISRTTELRILKSIVNVQLLSYLNSRPHSEQENLITANFQM